MYSSFYAAARGVIAQQQKLDVTANNLANINNYGYKNKSVSFSNLMYYNMNNQFELLEKIKRKDKCEILVNACCIPNCPRRAEHYRTIAKQQRIALQNRRNPTDKKIPIPGWHCEYGDHNSIHTIRNYVTYVSPEAIWEKYVPMGFTNFKIEGRTANLFQLVDTYCHYMIRPEYEGEARLLLLANLEKSHIISVNRPRPAKWEG